MQKQNNSKVCYEYSVPEKTYPASTEASKKAQGEQRENTRGKLGVNTQQVVRGNGIRPVLLADSKTLLRYGPVLRRLVVGLVDDVSDITLLSLEPSNLLENIPSPPVRVVTQTRRYYEPLQLSDRSMWRVNMAAPRLALYDKLFPGRHVARVVETLGAYRANLIHALSEDLGPFAFRLARQMNIPCIVTILGNKTKCIGNVIDRCDRILAWQSELACKLGKSVTQLANRISVFPIGTHIDDSTACFRDEGKAISMFCSGPFEYGFGMACMINAIKRLCQRGHNVLLFISGSGSEEYHLRQQIKKLSLQNNVHIIPPLVSIVNACDVWKDVLRDIDIFIQPWPMRSWRIDLLEAMSVGNAVVIASDNKNSIANKDRNNKGNENKSNSNKVNSSSNCGDNNLVIDGETALTVPFQDEIALSNTLNMLIEDKSMARRLAKNAQENLRHHFLASKMVEKLLEAYRKTLGN